MKSRFVLLFGVVVACAVAAQDGHKFERKYAVGESDTYSMNMNIESGMGPIDVSMDMTQAVKKVYDNGDADVETTIGSMKVNAMGNEMTPPDPPATTRRMTKRGTPSAEGAGAPAGGGPAGGMAMMLNFTRLGGVMADTPLKLGQAVPFEDATSGAKGTVTLESVAEGVAILVTKVEIKSPDGGNPMKIETRSWIDAASSKLNKLEGTIQNPPGQSQMPIESIKVTMTRKKA